MMLDEIRSMDWVPRSVRSKIDQIRQVTADFVKREGRPPERKEIADILGISQEELEESVTKNGRLLSLDEPMGNDEESFTLKDVVPDTDHPDPFTACLTAETQQALMSAIGLLSNRQQEVINLYYFKGLTMKEIGRQLGLTESGICRIHGLAVQRLRLEIEERQKVGSKKGVVA
jgi:RNA polymerase sigma factor for flagellar operon FliA